MTRNLYLVAAIFLTACAPTTATNTPAPTTTSTASTTTTTAPTTTTIPLPVVSPPRARTSPRAGRGVAVAGEHDVKERVGDVEKRHNPHRPWDALANCESGGRWDANTGNGHYGGLQFKLATWRSVGGAGYPHEASREEQIHRAEILLARSGPGQWPTCGRRVGLGR